MITVKFTFSDGIVSEGSYKDYDELTEYIRENFAVMSDARTMEVNVEGSDNN
jgi:hypothetical protein